MGESESILKVTDCWWLDQEIKLSRTSSSRLTRKSTCGGSSTCQGPSQRDHRRWRGCGVQQVRTFSSCLSPLTTGWNGLLDPVTYITVPLRLQPGT